MPDNPAISPSTRNYQLAGSYNFRDIGGYETGDGRHVRWGQVFRSDAIHRLTDADLDQLRPLHVRTILDLRSKREITAGGSGLIHGEPELNIVHIPFGRIGEEADPTWQELTLGELYRGIVVEAKGAIARVMTTLAESDSLPAVVHCAAGKDRTGVSIALLLRLLGVDDATITQDYVLTESNFSTFLERLSPEELEHLSIIPDELMRVDATVLAATFAIVDTQYGSTEAYLLDAGVSPESITRLRRRLLD